MLTSYYIMCYLLTAIAILFFISGLDDVFFDFFFWVRYWIRLWKTRKYPRLTYEQLQTVPEKKIAIFVPCWHEANVIGDMLNHNTYAIDYDNYNIFVGVYPNDPETIAAVQQIAEKNPHVQCVIGPRPGPTTKADNLNALYKHLEEIEQKNHVHYEIIVFHDSEDIIHPLSLKLYNYLIPRKDMIQVPVFPLEVSLRNFTHWVYNDEFSENHTKDIIVREAIKSLVPSAGVGTAFARSAIDMLATKNNGAPFTTETLTEDYHTALLLRLSNLKAIFLTQYVWRTEYKKRWHYWGKLVPKRVKEYVATRALFPTQYYNAVKQKARWIIGIALQEWEISGWKGNFTTRYTLLHDRKSMVTHVTNVISYILFGYWLFYSIWVMSHPQYPTLQEFFMQYPWVWKLIIACTIIMLERLLQRAIATYRIYGIVPALLSIPRAVYGNFMNMHALLRAYRLYFFKFKSKSKAGKSKWDKTHHTFPGASQLRPYNKKLGDLMLEKNIITPVQLTEALTKQMRTGEQLGHIFIKDHYIDHHQLTQLLSEQYHLEIVDPEKMTVLDHALLPEITKKDYHWLIKHHILPIKLEDNELTLAIIDPSNSLACDTAVKHCAAYKVKFALIAQKKLQA